MTIRRLPVANPDDIVIRVMRAAVEALAESMRRTPPRAAKKRPYIDAW